jgi:predicted ArsR family transcriptional regulator
MSYQDRRCPHCGKIDWRRAPELERVFNAVKPRGHFTAAWIADQLDIGIIQACNRLRELKRMGLVESEQIIPGKRWYIWRKAYGRSQTKAPKTAEGQTRTSLQPS